MALKVVYSSQVTTQYNPHLLTDGSFEVQKCGHNSALQAIMFCLGAKGNGRAQVAHSFFKAYASNGCLRLCKQVTTRAAYSSV